MINDRAYLNHCIAAVEAGNEARQHQNLCLIDGAILGRFTIDVEHAYRLAHDRDVQAMRQA